MNALSVFSGYVYSETFNYKNDGFPISWFLEENKDARYDAAIINKDTDKIIVYSGSNIIEEIPLEKAKIKYNQIRKSLM